MTENLHFIVWWCLTILALFAVGAIQDLAKYRKNKALLWLLVVPVAFLGYELWLFIVKPTVAAAREWRQLFFFAWVLLTFYLWDRGNNYKTDAERWRDAYRTAAPPKIVGRDETGE